MPDGARSLRPTRRAFCRTAAGRGLRDKGGRTRGQKPLWEHNAASLELILLAWCAGLGWLAGGGMLVGLCRRRRPAPGRAAVLVLGAAAGPVSVREMWAC